MPETELQKVKREAEAVRKDLYEVLDYIEEVAKWASERFSGNYDDMPTPPSIMREHDPDTCTRCKDGYH